MSDKKKFPRAEALAVAKELCAVLAAPRTERLIVAGSLRREKAMVGDAELLYIPKMVEGPPVDFFGAAPIVNFTEPFIEALKLDGILQPRPSITGHFAWGLQNKLAIHTASGIPVDLFCVLLPPCHCGVIHTNAKRTEQNSIQEALRPVRQILREQESENLQQEMQSHTSVEGRETKEGTQLSDASMRSMRNDVQEKLLQGAKGLLTDLQSNALVQPHGGETMPKQEVSGDNGIPRLQRIHTDLRSGEIRGTSASSKSQTGSHGLRSGASVDNGKTSKEAFAAERDGSSSEWNKGRQPVGEFGNRDEKSPHGKSDLSVLPKTLSNQINCPSCLGTGLNFGKWWVSLVIRTGGKQTNLLLTTGAQKLGRKLHAYGSGVEILRTGEILIPQSEEDVFEFCGVTYREPKDRL